jgi:hypothetical protein
MEESARERQVARLLICLRLILRSRAPSEAARILRSLSSMNDPHKAARYIGSALATLPPETIATVLQEVLDGLDRRESGAELAVEAMLCREMRTSWPAGLSQQVQHFARKEGKFDVATMLLELPDVDPRFVPTTGNLPKDLQKVPLGVRKAWARKEDEFLIDRLLADPDPAVVANLLDNPRLQLRDVIRLASNKGAGEDILELIATHRRWIALYPVKVTLAHNPATPVRIGLGLLRLLMTQDLKDLLAVGRVSGVVARRTREVLRERTGPSG